MPSKNFKQRIDELGKNLLSISGGAFPDRLGHDSDQCKGITKELAEILNLSKEARLGFYKYCMVRSLQGHSAQRTLQEEERRIKTCINLATRIVDDPTEAAEFVGWCTTKLRAGESVEDILQEQDDEVSDT
ncbi:MAG: hypothetical protein HWN65_05560 [Candidatus Helarchaeota archaeon]|nr:hypothetical protein [Candidatus Helarchaeota archaeon]